MSSSSSHYSDVIMTTMASEITSLTVVYSTVYSDADQRKHQSSASLAFVWGIHRDRWIPRTKGQLRGKCFHLMTSSWSKGAELTHWPLGDFEGNFRWVIFDVIILLISCEIVLVALNSKTYWNRRTFAEKVMVEHMFYTIFIAESKRTPGSFAQIVKHVRTFDF